MAEAGENPLDRHAPGAAIGNPSQALLKATQIQEIGRGPQGI